MATFMGNLQTVKCLLHHGADVNQKENNVGSNHNELLVYVHLCTQCQWTALHVACQEGHEGIARLLIEKKADVNSKDEVDTVP